LEHLIEFNSYLWSFLTYFLLGTGLFFTIRTKFIQLRKFPQMFKVMFGPNSGVDGSISSFQAYCTSLAGRVGTGNLAGVAIAITVGGPGAVFWMWIVSLVGMVTACVESSLAQLYKEREDLTTFRGGPAFYMERALGSRSLGILFSISLLFCYGFAFNAVQSDSMANAMDHVFSIDKSWVGVATVVMTVFVIFGGIHRIARFAEMLVPFMAISYLLIAFTVIALNISELPHIFMIVIKDAFGLQEAAGGILGLAIKRAIVKGTERGLFSNEAGMGSAPNAAATADVKHPVEQGFVQMLGVFTDTIVICSATAFIVLVSGKYTGWEADGISLTQSSLTSIVGEWGGIFIAITLLFFAFTSITANYYYGENSIEFILPEADCPKRKRLRLIVTNIYRIMVLGMVYWGAVSSGASWEISNTAMGFMTIINLVAILLLTKPALILIKDYEKQLDNSTDGEQPVFDIDILPEKYQKRVSEGTWGKNKGDETDL
jgi:AGCS family alanine or glycine:cation symporter